MKIKSLASIPAAAMIAIGAMVTGMLQPAVAQQGDTFYCGEYEGKLATMVRTNHRGSIPIVFWQTNYFSDSGWPPQRRCDEVSRRFQVYHEKEQLNYLTTGRMNGYPVLCIAKSPESHSARNGVVEGGLLITLRPDVDNPNTVLETITGVRDGARNPLNHAIEAAEVNDEEGRLYINLEEYIFQVEKE